MVLKFQSALFGVGLLLVIIGVAVAFMAAAQLEQAGSITDALSAGVTSSFFALFSGVLIGIGCALVVGGLLLSAKNRSISASASFLLCFAAMLASAAFLGKAAMFSFAMLLAFLASIVFAGAMLVVAVIFSFSDLLRAHLNRSR